MCAIAGYFNCLGQPIDPAILYRMTHIQRHRGPDGEGYVFLDPSGRQKPQYYRTMNSHAEMSGAGQYPIGFGHRRLAILDLSDRGQQPMTAADGRYWVVYNGEIYNYRELREELRKEGYDFRSQSDTEVLLCAYQKWGVHCLERFNGMFSFALWDGMTRQLVCARDRFGEKPFYYMWDGKCFSFASEMKGLLPLLQRRDPDQQVVHAYLDQSALDYSDRTMLAGVRQLPPAQYLIVQEGTLTTRRYWDLPATVSDAAAPPFERAVETFSALFHDSVRLRLRSDVPIGSCLSGGLDSSSIVCVANGLLLRDHQGSRHPSGTGQHTFSSCFQEAQYDERHFRQYVVDQTGVNAHDTFPNEKTLTDEIERLIWHQEEPVGSTSVFAQWCVMRLAAGHGIKVLLDGQGADELLAGYHGFYGPLLADMMCRGRWSNLVKEWRAYRRLHGAWPRYVFANFARAVLPRPLVGAMRERLTGSVKWIDPEFHRQWRVDQFEDLSGTSHVHAMQARLLTGNGLRALLHYEDRNAMASGIETRLPFLDHRLVEFVFPLPGNYKIREGWTKVLLREGMKGILPEPVRQRVDKMGFVTPEALWFRTGLREMVRDVLHDPRTRTRGYVNVTKAEKEFETHVAGRHDISNTIWRWVNLELWCRQFIDELPCNRFSSC